MDAQKTRARVRGVMFTEKKMESINKYLWTLIVLVISYWALEFYLQNIYASTNPSKESYAPWASGLVVYGYLQHLVAALWLRSEAKKVNDTMCLPWMIFALLYNIYAIGIYYLKVIFEKSINNET